MHLSFSPAPSPHGRQPRPAACLPLGKPPPLCPPASGKRSTNIKHLPQPHLEGGAPPHAGCPHPRSTQTPPSPAGPAHLQSSMGVCSAEGDTVATLQATPAFAQSLQVGPRARLRPAHPATQGHHRPRRASHMKPQPHGSGGAAKGVRRTPLADRQDWAGLPDSPRWLRWGRECARITPRRRSPVAPTSSSPLASFTSSTTSSSGAAPSSAPGWMRSTWCRVPVAVPAVQTGAGFQVPVTTLALDPSQAQCAAPDVHSVSAFGQGRGAEL